jgi:hypothetical protein
LFNFVFCHICEQPSLHMQCYLKYVVHWIYHSHLQIDIVVCASWHITQDPFFTTRTCGLALFPILCIHDSNDHAISMLKHVSCMPHIFVKCRNHFFSLYFRFTLKTYPPQICEEHQTWFPHALCSLAHASCSSNI